MPAGILVYRPQRSEIEDLEAILVSREPLLRELMANLRGSGRNHFLLLGPRGIGKTTVLQVVMNRARQDPELGRNWAPILFPEENNRIRNIADLLLKALQILAEDTGDVALEELYQSLKWEQDNRKVTDLALDGFRFFHRETGKNILLLIENLEKLLEKQLRPKTEVQLLRKIFLEEDWLLTLTTTPTYLSSLADPREPFYEFFRIRTLMELTPGEQLTMLRKLGDLSDNHELDDYLDRFHSRLRALYHFTGGNPRLTVMLYDLIANKRIKDVTSELNLLLDQLTPFYEKRMDDLSQQEGRLLETMALMPEGCAPKDLAKEARISPDSARSLLSRLEIAGYIKREPLAPKKSVYIIPERFFRIWHRMNHSRAARGQVLYLLEFFQSWYATPEERDRVWDELADELERGNHEGDDESLKDVVDYMKYVVSISEGGEKIRREFERLEQVLKLDGRVELDDELGRLDRTHGDDKEYFIHKGRFFSDHLTNYPDALAAFRCASKIDSEDIIALCNQAIVLRKLGRWPEAASVEEKVIGLLAKQRGYDQVDKFEFMLNILKEEEDYQIVRITSYVLRERCGRSQVDQVTKILSKAYEPWRKRLCVNTLGYLQYELVIPVLLDALHDRENEVRGAAATALGRIGSPRAVDALLRCLEDEADDVRGSAATALGRIGSPQAVDALLRCLEDEANKVRGSAAGALGLLKATEATKALIHCLSDSDEVVRGSSASSLGKIVAIEAIRPLLNLFDQHPENRINALMALTRIFSAKYAPGAEKVLASLLDQMKERSFSQFRSAAEALLKSTFRSGDTALIQRSLDRASQVEGFDHLFWSHYQLALRYLKSSRDSQILNRQYPEMREAILMLVGIFDSAETPVS